MSRKSFLVMLVLLACLGVLPLLGSAYALRLGTLACMYAVMAVSWTVIGGFAGYPSFGTAAFFGMGAYTGGILLGKGAGLVVAVSAAGLLAMAFALLLGMVLLRLKGHYFAVASLAVAEVLRELTNTATDLTGGGTGLNIALGTIDAGQGVLAQASFFFWAMWVMLVLTFVVVRWVEVSKLGFGLACIRQNEPAADMIGVNATIYKSVAFGVSGVFVAMAGALYGAWVNYIEPPDVFDVLYSIKPIVMALLGGVGSPAGAVLGAFAFLGIEELVWRNFLQIHTGVLGLLVVLLLLFLPRGLMTLTQAFKPRRRATQEVKV